MSLSPDWIQLPSPASQVGHINQLVGAKRVGEGEVLKRGINRARGATIAAEQPSKRFASRSIAAESQRMNSVIFLLVLSVSVLGFAQGQGFGFDSARRRQFGPFSNNNQLYPYPSGPYPQQQMVGSIAQQSSGYGFDSARRRMFGGGGPGMMYGTNMAGAGGPAYLNGGSPIVTETHSQSRTLQSRGGGAGGLPGFFG